MQHRRPASKAAARRQAQRRASAQAALPSAERLLAAVARPAARTTATAPRSGDGLRVSRPLDPPWWAFAPLSWVVPVAKTKTVDLDALGREVWERLDGTRTVEAIVEDFAEHHRLPFADARESVTRFLRLLLERGMIEFTEAPA